MEATATTTTLGVVLAGGQSVRMGRNKAILRLGDEPLLQRVVARLARAVEGVVVIGPEALRDVVPSIAVIPDELPGAGPLGGLYTAFVRTNAVYLFMVACDMPFLVPELVRAQLNALACHPRVDVVALRSMHGLEYMHAAYRRSCLTVIEAQLAAGERSLHGFLRHLRVYEYAPEAAALLDPQGVSAFNANTPEDWQRAEALAAQERPLE